jgi:hypothetical protein
MADIEHQNQVALMAWAALASRKQPELAMLNAIPNGGLRSKATAGRLKAEGVKAGYPDLVLDIARAGYHSLKIEMKAGRNKPSEAQEWWIAELIKQGHRVYVAYDWEIARELITAYLDGSPFDGIVHKHKPQREDDGRTTHH